MIPVASIREGLEIFAGELEAVIRELPELEGQGGGVRILNQAPPAPFRESVRLAEENGWFLANQFHNPANLDAHYGTARFTGTLR